MWMSAGWSDMDFEGDEAGAAFEVGVIQAGPVQTVIDLIVSFAGTQGCIYELKRGAEAAVSICPSFKALISLSVPADFLGYSFSH